MRLRDLPGRCWLALPPGRRRRAGADHAARVLRRPNQRPDLMRKLFDQYEAANPGVKIEIETGGATSELQRQYLSTVLNAKDSAIDIYLIDIVNPAQYFGAGWLEPLDAYLGAAGRQALKPYLPVYRSANVVDGKVAAMPAFADAMFMYYRQGPARKARRGRAQDLGRTGRRGAEDPGRRGQPQPAGPVASRARRSKARSAPSCCPTGARARSSTTPPAG
jgi:hypothetical protein